MPQTLLYRYYAPYGQPIRTRIKHYHAGRLVEGFHLLKIVEDSSEAAVRILRYDHDGHEIQRTWHESVDKALDDAEREFEIRRDEWEAVHLLTS